MTTLRKPLSGAADWLSLAAAPTFSAMAVVTAVSGAPDTLCAASPIGGMVPMYLLMGVFHVGPWLRLLATARPDCRAHS